MNIEYTEIQSQRGHGTSREHKKGLFLVAQRAKDYPSEKFNNLLHHLNIDLVRKHIQSMRKTTAKGPDGLSRDEVLENLSWLFPRALESIHKKRYKAPPTRRTYIPKANGKQRPLAIGNILDRGIQAALAEILNAIYEQDFLDCSWGFRPKRGCHQAIADFNKQVHWKGQDFVLEVDLENFFGTLNHEWLLKFLKHRVEDSRILALIEAWLNAGVLEKSILIKENQGTVQGGPISPILANIYLHYVLDLWFEKAVRPKLKDRSSMIRFADDFVICFWDQRDLHKVYSALVARLSQFGLKVSEEKTYKSKIGTAFKGFKRSVDFLGLTMFKAKKKTGKGWKVIHKTNGKKFTQAKAKMKVTLYKQMHLPLEVQAKRINAILRGHNNYYGLPGNSYKLGAFYNETRKYWKRVLTRRTRDKFIGWDQFDEILKKNRIITPRLKYTYSSFSSYIKQTVST